MLPPETHIGSVQLRIKNIEQVLSFYHNLLGFQYQYTDTGTTVLFSSTSKNPLFNFFEDTNALRKPPKATGLYHIAIRLPDRKSLGSLLARIIESGYPLVGAADHLVSEAIYLNDPEGNGLELYCDRKRSEWPMVAGQIAMGTNPLDVESLINEARTVENTQTNIPASSDIGHIHLSISNLNRSETFYQEYLGLDVTQRSYPGALFLSAGGYHHHIGLNIWSSRDASPPPPGTMGLISFDLIVGDVSIHSEIQRRLTRSSIKFNVLTDTNSFSVTDPDGIIVNIR